MARRKRRRSPAHDVPPGDLPRSAGLVAIALKLALVPVVFDPAGDATFGVAKSALSRGLLYILLAIVAAHLATDAAARRRALRPGAIGAAILTFTAIAGVATALAVDQRTALFGAHHRYLGLTSIVDGAAVALVLPMLVRTLRDLAIVLAGLFGGATLVAIYGLAQVAGLDPVSWRDATLSSTIGNRGFVAGFFTVIACAAAAAAAMPVIDRRVRAALVVLAAAGVWLVLASGARGPALALPVAAAIGALAARHHLGWLTRDRRRVALAVAAVVAFTASTAWIALPRLSALLSASNTSVAERSLVYGAALAMIRERPVLGAGPDHFAVLYPAMRPPGSAELALVAPGQTSAHSWVLHHAVGTGILGLAALLAIVGLSLRRAWSGEAPAIGGAMLVGFVLQGLFNVSDVSSEALFWVAVGLSSSGPLVPTEARRARGRGLVALAVGLAFGLAAATTTLSWVAADRDVRASDVLRSRGMLDAAQRAANSATQRDPGRANSWNVLGLARAPASPSRALVAFRRASDLAPYDATFAMNAAKEALRASASDKAMAEIALRYSARAVAADPSGPEARFVRGFVLLRTGDASGGLEEAERAIALRPARTGDALQAEFLASDAAKALGRAELAAAHLRSALDLAVVRGHPLAAAIRLDLARLLVATGRADEGRAMLAAPRLTGADGACEPKNGFDEITGVGKFPRCIHLVFAVSAILAGDAGSPSSAARPDRYAVDGRPLPAGSTITVGGVQRTDGVPVAQAVEIQLPKDATAPRPGAKVSVTGVTDEMGNVVRPDPSTTALR